MVYDLLNFFQGFDFEQNIFVFYCATYVHFVISPVIPFNN